MKQNYETAGNEALLVPLRAQSKAASVEAFNSCEGGVTAPQGFSAAGVHAGFRKDPTRLDFALVAADEPCACAGVFTTNVFCSAPVLVSREHLENQGFGLARAVVVNSGNANAATGTIGYQTAEKTAMMTADALGCTPQEVMVASTGVIGVHLPLEPFDEGLRLGVEALSSQGGADAARAIMTTDTCPKECACTFSGEGIGFEGDTFCVGGMAKGSGMIMPNMATMISVITTDAPVEGPALHQALVKAANQSFNKVTVDSDTSTNDCCFLFASGAASSQKGAVFEPGSPAFERFTQALDQVCQTLARKMAADGEGATRLITVNVEGAASVDDADLAARAVANSPLVKTAVCGHDANWGRIAMAIGKCGAQFQQEHVDIDIMGLPVCRKGLTVAFDEDEALRRFENAEIVIDINLGAGQEETTVWSCDFTHDYITINGDYRS